MSYYNTPFDFSALSLDLDDGFSDLPVAGLRRQPFLITVNKSRKIKSACIFFFTVSCALTVTGFFYHFCSKARAFYQVSGEGGDGRV